ncbi:Fe-S cluster assembly ATPase SufC [Patescibacteria group bacterium]|nr:Fe-S cluster assembly ATPase SufC [Patescibacteria group bacterium]
MLELQNVTVKAKKKTLLHDISETFDVGKVYAIMGPNGSGKSTLAQSILGHPGLTLTKKSKILLHGKDITGLATDKRAAKGLFMTFQNPLAIDGVTVFNVLQYALEKSMTSEEIREKAYVLSEKLGISKELLERPLNVAFSGGEKKKLEVLQAAVIDPDLIIFDEVDTGVDVDALRRMTLVISEMKARDPKKTMVVITHYTRILDYITPDEVLVMKEGSIVDRGPYALAQKIDAEGYTQYEG